MSTQQRSFPDYETAVKVVERADDELRTITGDGFRFHVVHRHPLGVWVQRSKDDGYDQLHHAVRLLKQTTDDKRAYHRVLLEVPSAHMSDDAEKPIAGAIFGLLHSACEFFGVPEDERSFGPVKSDSDMNPTGKPVIGIFW